MRCKLEAFLRSKIVLLLTKLSLKAQRFSGTQGPAEAAYLGRSAAQVVDRLGATPPRSAAFGHG